MQHMAEIPRPRPDISLYINSLQNKFEEIKLINKKLKATIIVLIETKIGSSYHNSQFVMTNYRVFRNDRKKAGEE